MVLWAEVVTIWRELPVSHHFVEYPTAHTDDPET